MVSLLIKFPSGRRLSRVAGGPVVDAITEIANSWPDDHVVITYSENDADGVINIVAVPTVEGLEVPMPLARHMLIFVPEQDEGTLAIVYSIDETEMYSSASTRELPNAVSTFIRRLQETQSIRAQALWRARAEVLLTCVGRLLHRQDDLEKELAAVLGDLDVAKARVAELEAIKTALELELTRSKNKTSRDLIIQIALIIATILGPVGAIAADHALAEPVRVTIEAAHSTADAARLDLAPPFNNP